MSFLHPLLPGECRQHIEKRLLCIKLLLLRTGKKNRIFSLSYSLTHKNTFSVFSSHTHTHILDSPLSLNIPHTPTCMAHSQSFFLLFISPLLYLELSLSLSHSGDASFVPVFLEQAAVTVLVAQRSGGY